MTSHTHDIIVVGGGTAGLVTAAGAAQLGARAALVEARLLGGDCLWTGCVPSKALLAFARGSTAVGPGAPTPRPLGGPGSPSPWPGAVAWMRAARERIARHDDPDRFRALGVDVVFSPARLAGPDAVETVTGTLRAKRIVIATGAVPATPSIPGLEQIGFINHATAYDRPALPPSLVIVGGGPVGVEFAQLYARLGVRVALVEVQPCLVPREDPDVGRFVRDVLMAEGVAVHTGFRAAAVRAGGAEKSVVALDGQRVTGEEIFVATGRAPNTADLEPGRAGVELDDRGAVRVDSRLATSVRGVWAGGDVVGGLQFTHVAEYHARTIVRNALTPFPTRADHRAVPWVTFTDPEIARVGLTAAEAETGGLRPSVYRVDFESVDRAVVDGTAVGFAKVVTRRGGRIVGATVVGLGAGELIMQFVLAMRHGLRLRDLLRAVHPYPTMSEIVKRAAEARDRERMAGRMGHWLRRAVRWWL